jgi:hypothetical protein
VICDNLSAHKAPVVHKWLLAHPRVQLHFTPTYSSWISQAERWFAELQRRCLDRGVFCSLDELTTALENWIKFWNASARPFKWTKTADQIIDASAATAHASPDRDTRRSPSLINRHARYLELLSRPVDQDLLGSVFLSLLAGSLDEFAVDEGRSGADQGDEVGGVDGAPAVLR